VAVTADDDTVLGSVGARDLVSYYAHGKSVAYKRTDHLLHENLLEVLWAVDPSCFFYAYVQDGKLHAVPPPSRIGAYRIPLTHSKASAARVIKGTMNEDELLPDG